MPRKNKGPTAKSKWHTVQSKWPTLKGMPTSSYHPSPVKEHPRVTYHRSLEDYDKFYTLNMPKQAERELKEAKRYKRKNLTMSKPKWTR